MFTAPTAFRSIKKEDPQGKFFAQYDLEKFRTLFFAGERADPDTLVWAEKLLKRPVIDHWWQTEGDYRQSGRPRAIAGEARFVDGGDARLRRAGGRPELQGSAGEHARIHCGQIAIGTCVSADAMAAGWLFRAKLPRRVPRLLQNRRRGHQRRRGPHLP